eukprot:12888042-Prorocentrum_lima.AAC.1
MEDNYSVIADDKAAEAAPGDEVGFNVWLEASVEDDLDSIIVDGGPQTRRKPESFPFSAVAKLEGRQRWRTRSPSSLANRSEAALSAGMASPT